MSLDVLVDENRTILGLSVAHERQMPTRRCTREAVGKKSGTLWSSTIRCSRCPANSSTLLHCLPNWR